MVVHTINPNGGGKGRWISELDVIMVYRGFQDNQSCTKKPLSKKQTKIKSWYCVHGV